MRSTTLRRQSSLVFAFVATAACSSNGEDDARDTSTETTDAAGSSDTGATEDVGSTDASTSAPGDESSESTSESTTSSADSTETGASSDTSAGDSTSTGDPSGVWCEDAVVVSLEGLYGRPLPFHMPYGGPTAIVAGVMPEEGIEAAVFDIATSTWTEPTTLFEGAVELEYLDQNPWQAMDAAGNGIMVHARFDPPGLVAQHYDAATSTWSSVDLPMETDWPRFPSLHVAGTGDALALVRRYGEDTYDDILVATYSAQTQEWTAGPVLGPVYQDWETIPAAIDTTSGDAVVVVNTDPNRQLARFDAVSGEWSFHEFAEYTYIIDVVPTGDGTFVAVSITSTWNQIGELRAHRFDGDAWLEPEIIADQDMFSTMTIHGTPDGRAAVAWWNSLGVLSASVRDPATGWSDPIAVNDPEQQGGNPYEVRPSIALQPTGFVVGWSQTIDSFYVDAFVRRWDEVGGLHDVVAVEGGGTFDQDVDVADASGDRTRAIWRVPGLDGSNYETCDALGTDWSAPTDLDAYFVEVAQAPDGDMLVARATRAGVFADFHDVP
jgi:hypothetical protein